MNELMIKNIAHTVGGMKGTMSSLEIAKLTGKSHSHVMRDIRDFLDEIDEGDRSRFGSIYKDSYGRDQECFLLPKRECLGLASKYDAKLRMAIIDRWAELEYKEQGGASMPVLCPQAQAANELKDTWTPLLEMYQGLGYSEGACRAEFLEIATMKEAEHNVELLSPAMKVTMLPGTSMTTDKSAEGHAALVSVGGRGVKPTALAIQLGKRPQEVNGAMVALGWQARLGNGLFVPCQPGRKFCYTKECTKGGHKGTEVIDTWQEALVWKHLVEFFEARTPKTANNEDLING